MPIVKFASTLLYDHLLHAGVKIFEYCERPLHGKVALVDGEWATVGSSNLDPLSLSLNLEANLMIRDRGFNDVLAGRLQHLIRHSCKEVLADPGSPERRWPALRSAIVFHFLRRFPSWASWLPTHVPKVDLLRS
jgi:cardiolipin synthase